MSAQGDEQERDALIADTPAPVAGAGVAVVDSTTGASTFGAVRGAVAGMSGGLLRVCVFSFAWLASLSRRFDVSLHVGLPAGAQHGLRRHRRWRGHAAL